uniref:Uncharacterized protein n=1 Tax=Arundo donax TaxID=35708 RepID=A0A0A9ASQ1_ARUDO
MYRITSTLFFDPIMSSIGVDANTNADSILIVIVGDGINFLLNIEGYLV